VAARQERIRYVIGGIWNTVFGYAVFAALYTAFGDRVSYLILAVITHCVATANAFVTYRFFVFRVRGQAAKDFSRFVGVYAAVLVFSLLGLRFLVEVAGLPVLAAQAIVVALAVVGSYLAHRNFSFRRPRPARET
jgi:putative flippase GtrA